MPKNRPATSGYAQIAQAEEEEEDSGLYHDEDPFADPGSVSTPGSRYAPIQPKKQRGMEANVPPSPRGKPRRSTATRPRRSNSGVDIKAINQRLERWAEEIASKFRRRRRTEGDDEQPEILHSVFQAPEWIKPATAEDLAAYEAAPHTKMSKIEYEDIVESIRVAIELGVHPKLISKGSSGSYFARNGDGKTMGVFKPKDEEPYASKNPKWTKWIHRNLFPFAFGRVCLIPNLSYVSEAAAYVLDTQLRTNIVPPTEVVAFSSKSFHYDFWDRRAYYRKRKPLPEKQGSLQIFLKGFTDATEFLREHPWPDRHNTSFKDTEHRKKKRRWTDDCRPGGTLDDEDEDVATRVRSSAQSRDRGGDAFWTEQLQQSMREQLEKLVILDYIMRNTDRGLDNWMIKIDQGTQEAKIVVEPPGKPNGRSTDNPTAASGDMGQTNGYTREEPMSTTSRSSSPTVVAEASVSLGAIDNSLSWPWKHPDAWRSYPFGWLFLPVSLIGRPFSESTRQHFLPLLTSKQWWMDTQLALRRCFMQDADFQERMFARQMAVMKGQAWNVVETLKTPDHGPLELTRRTRVCVWDDVQEVPVAVPMGRPSKELRDESMRDGGTSVRFGDTEEMDISAVRHRPSTPPTQAQSLPHQDLLGSPPLDANRFNISRQNSSGNVKNDDPANAGALSPGSMQQVSWSASTNDVPKAFSAKKSRPEYKARMSYDEPRRVKQPLSPETRRRRFSLNVRRPSNPLSAAFGFGGDDDEDDDGDLGYSAAEDREGNRKKVIVERLETVKSRKPFFEWC